MLRSDLLKAAAALPLAMAPLAAGAADDAVRFASVPADAAADIYVAQAGGFLKRAGIAPEVTTASNGNAAVAGMIGGTLDLAAINLVSLAQAIERGVPLTLVALGAEYDSTAPTTALMVANDSTLRRASDLAGKTISVNELKGLAQASTQAWIDQNGGDSTTVKFVELPFRAAAAALTQHRIDVGFVSEPFVTLSKTDCRILGKPYDSIAPRFPYAGYCSTLEWLNGHVELANRVHNAMHEAAVWANHHHDETAQIMSDQAKLDIAVLKASNRAMFSEGLNLPPIQRLLDLALKYGLLTRHLDARDLFSRQIWK